MSTVKEMIQIAFEYEVKIQQMAQEIQKLQSHIKTLEQTLASYTANSKPLSEKKVKELVGE